MVVKNRSIQCGRLAIWPASCIVWLPGRCPSVCPPFKSMGVWARRHSSGACLPPLHVPTLSKSRMVGTLPGLAALSSCGTIVHRYPYVLPTPLVPAYSVSNLIWLSTVFLPLSSGDEYCDRHLPSLAVSFFFFLLFIAISPGKIL